MHYLGLQSECARSVDDILIVISIHNLVIMNIGKYENFSGAAHHKKIFSKILETPLIPTVAGMPSLHEEPSGSKDGRRE